VAAIIIGPLARDFTHERIFYVTVEGSVTGSAVKGAMGLVPTAILTLLLVTAIGVMQAGGFLDKFIDWLQKTVARSVQGTELAIVGLITFTNICVSVNTVAMITAGPLANILRKRYEIHPYRSANLLDTVSCSFPYLLPYAATIVAAVAIQQQVAERYDFVPVLSGGQFVPYCFYGLVLFPLMIVAVITGFGRERG
jgi:Na+/H+ antiporter NhaC